MPAVNTAKRQSYSLTFKLAVIKTAKASSNSSAARTHKLDESFVRKWKRNEAALVAAEKKKCIVADAVLVLLEEVEP